MKIDILTLFPEMFDCLNLSILGRAIKNKKLELNTVNIRDFSKNKQKNCDDTPFGGGAGMVMLAQPIYDALQSVKSEDSFVIYTSPQGEKLSQNLVKELSQKKHLIILCGHYEGVDQRVLDLCVDKEVSIGDYVLTGGEIPAMAIVDSVSRYVDGVINNESLIEESFSSNLLEYPQYTRPQNFMGLEVPSVLLSGNHKEIANWRQEQSLKITKEKRPDLINKKG